MPEPGGGGQTYAILDGVRRAKAAQMLGRDVIDAQVEGVGPVVQLPLANVLSPKDRIDTTGVRGIDWGKVYRATQRGLALPPISVTPSANGLLLQDVEVAQNELDFFR